LSSSPTGENKRYFPNHHPDLSCIVCEIPLPRQKNGSPNLNETPNSITSNLRKPHLQSSRFLGSPDLALCFFLGGVFGDEKNTRKWMDVDLCLLPLFTQTTIMAADLDNEQLTCFFSACCFCGTFETPSFKKKWTHFVWEKNDIKTIEKKCTTAVSKVFLEKLDHLTLVDVPLMTSIIQSAPPG